MSHSPAGSSFPRAENEVEKNEIQFARMRLSAAHAGQTGRISFLHTLSLRTVNALKKTETRTQYKADGLCFPIHPAAELVGRHSSILVDRFFARGLAIFCDEISLPNGVPNRMQKPVRLPVRFSRTISTAFFNDQGRATIPLCLWFSMQSTKIGLLLAHLTLQDSRSQECPSKRSGGGATDLNLVPVVPLWLAEDDAG